MTGYRTRFVAFTVAAMVALVGCAGPEILASAPDTPAVSPPADTASAPAGDDLFIDTAMCNEFVAFNDRMGVDLDGPALPESEWDTFAAHWAAELVEALSPPDPEVVHHLLAISRHGRDMFYLVAEYEWGSPEQVEQAEREAQTSREFAAGQEAINAIAFHCLR